MTDYDLQKEVDNILQSEYSAVITKLSGLADEEKYTILAACIIALNGEQTKKNGRLRIAAVRAIVALLPLSLGAIAELLTRRQNKHHYEVHFTLFCYLDWSQEMPVASSVTKEILFLAENYLMTVPHPTARAGWMAGHMLGENWNQQEALPVLARAAQYAKYAEGRQSSLAGLETMLERLSVNDKAQIDMRKTLKKLSLTDRSGSVKEAAKALLKRRRESHKLKNGPSV